MNYDNDPIEPMSAAEWSMVALTLAFLVLLIISVAP
jgi:hypothetical protein